MGVGNRVLAEEATRAAADTALGDRITAETTAREQADAVHDTRLGVLENNDIALADALDDEGAVREAADTALNNRIAAEERARENEDQKLQSNITAEATARKNADIDLASRISSVQNINTQQTERIAAVEAHNVIQDQKIESNTQRIGNLEDRTNRLDKDIKKAGASAVALAALKPIQYNPLKPTQIMAGVGTFRGETSTALGVAHYSNENTMFHIGAAYGGSNSFAANAGVTFAVGSGSDKKYLPAEYQNGPISSVYVLQNEVAQLKAENEQVKRILMQVLESQQTEA